MHPTEALREEHRVIERALAALGSAAARLEEGRDVPSGVLEDLLDFVRGFADGCHHQKEEGILFPYLEARGMPRDEGPLGVMLAEHDVGRRHVQAMAEAVEREEPEAFVAHARGYTALLHDHIAKEDHVLFPMAEQLVGPEDVPALRSKFEEAEAELEGRHARYLRLVARVERALEAE